MPDVTLINPDTGRILQQSHVPEHDVHLQNTRRVAMDDGTIQTVVDNSVVIIEGSHDGRKKYWLNNEIVDRPKLMRAEELRLAIGESFGINDAPEGTGVMVLDGSDVRTWEHTGGQITIVSQRPTTFRVILSPPFPWQRQDFLVVIE